MECEREIVGDTKMNRYEYTITLSGCGETPQDGWIDALDTIYSDTHFDHYDASEIETKITDKNIED